MRESLNDKVYTKFRLQTPKEEVKGEVNMRSIRKTSHVLIVQSIFRIFLEYNFQLMFYYFNYVFLLCHVTSIRITQLLFSQEPHLKNTIEMKLEFTGQEIQK